MISIKEARLHFSYNSTTGEITRISTGKVINRIARPGTSSTLKYYVTSRRDEIIIAHRLAWLLFHGREPVWDIDHINGNGLDNRISNLRAVDRGENLRNQRIYKNSPKGIHGIRKELGSWRVRIGVEKKSLHIGKYKDFFEACCARKSAENKHGYHANHGRSL